MNYFKKLFLKLKIKVRHLREIKMPKLSEHEMICFEIFKKYLFDQDCKLLMSPELTFDVQNSYKRYICKGEIDNPDVAIVITYTTIRIINHTYVYTITINKQLYTKIIEMFDRRITKERNRMEKSIYRNITDGLSKLMK